MSDVVSVIGRLDALSQQMDALSRKLAEVERQLVSVETEHEEFVAEHEEGLWHRHVKDGEKFPAEAMRLRMAHRAWAPEKLGRYVSLTSQRRRLREQISIVKAQIDAQRSILSALKEEAAAAR